MTGPDDRAAAGGERLRAGHADRERVMLAANVLDPHGLGNPHHPWSTLCALVALAALLTGIGILLHGLGTAEEQRRARKQRPLSGPSGFSPGPA